MIMAFRSYRVALLLGFSLLCSMGAGAALAQAETRAAEVADSEVDDVLAEVNGKAIRYSDVVGLAESISPADGALVAGDEELRSRLLGRLIERELLLAEADRRRIDQMDDFKAELQGIKDSLVLRNLLTLIKDELVTEEAIDKLYKEQLSAYKPVKEYHAAHILLQTENEAKDILALLKDGADFSTTAQERSRDPSAQSNKGDLGFFALDVMVPEFSEGIRTMKVGELSNPIKTQHGWHIAKLLDVRDVPFPTLEDKHDELVQEIFSTQIEAYLKSLRDESDVVMK